MSVDKMIIDIESKEKSIKDKVHVMEKELIEIYEQYSNSVSSYVKVETDKNLIYEMQLEPCGELKQYKISFNQKTDFFNSISGNSIISHGHQSYYKWSPFSPSYVSALKKLKEYMITGLEEKQKKLDKLEKRFE